MALSTTESEYLAIGSCGSQLLWIMHQLLDFNLCFEGVPIFCDNTSAISLSQYTVHHSRAEAPKMSRVTADSASVLLKEAEDIKARLVSLESNVLIMQDSLSKILQLNKLAQM